MITLHFGLAVVVTTKHTIVLSDTKSIGWADSVGTAPAIDKLTGLARPGAYLKTGQPCASVRVNKPGEDPKYHLETLSLTESGFVVSAEVKGDTAEIILAELTYIEPGDKVEGLHGNKGVVGKIVPYNEMPFDENGDVPDLILNTIGVIARSNMGQLTEGVQGAMANKDNQIRVSPPYSKTPITAILDEARDMEITEHDIYDGRDGKKFPHKGFIGIVTYLRLEHIADSKYNACGGGDQVLQQKTLQPKSGKGGGQKVSEQGAWSSKSYGADAVFETMFTAQSDDIKTKHLADMQFATDHKVDCNYKSSNIDILNAYYRALGITIASTDSGVTVEPLTNASIAAISNRHCDLSKILNIGNDAATVLQDASVFGRYGRDNESLIESRKHYGILDLPFDIVMPIFLNGGEVTGMILYADDEANGAVKPMTSDTVQKLLLSQLYVSGTKRVRASLDWLSKFNEEFDIQLPDEVDIPLLKSVTPTSSFSPLETGILAITEIFKTYDVRDTLAVYPLQNEQANSIYSNDKPIISVVPRIGVILHFTRNYSLSDLVISSLLVPPVGYRATYIDKKSMKEASSTGFDYFYKGIVTYIYGILTAIHRRFGNTSSTRLPLDDTDILEECKKDIRDLYGKIAVMCNCFNSTYERLKPPDSIPNLIAELTSHENKHAIMRDTQLSKRISYTCRSVISVNPKLKFGTCGMPISILCVIFQKKLITIFSKDTNNLYPHLNVFFSKRRGTTRKSDNDREQVLSALATDNIVGFHEHWLRARNCESDLANSTEGCYKYFCTCRQELCKALTKLLEKYPFLLNREPSLHKFAYQGFMSVAVPTKTIQLHPLNCKAYNADYDGDQMAGYLPIHEAAIADTLSKMMSKDNLIDPKDGSYIIAINQDIILGLYYSTIHKNNVITLKTPKDLAPKYIYSLDTTVPQDDERCVYVDQLYSDFKAGIVNLHDRVVVTEEGRGYVSEIGRIFANSLFPAGIGFTKVPVLDFTKQSDLNTEELDRLKQMYNAALKSYTDLQDFYAYYTDEIKEKTQALLTHEFGIPLYHIYADFIWKRETIDNVIALAEAYFMELEEKQISSGDDAFARFFERLKHMGFSMSDYSGITISLFDFERLNLKPLVDDFRIPAEEKVGTIADLWDKGYITEAERIECSFDIWSTVRKNVTDRLKKYFASDDGTFNRNDNIFMIVDSGARGSIGQLVETAGLVGTVLNAANQKQEMPILSSYIDGLSAEEAFVNAYTARKQTSAAQLSTADTGEQTRELIYTCEHIHSSDSGNCCDADSTLIIPEYELSLDSSLSIYTSIDSPEYAAFEEIAETRLCNKFGVTNTVLDDFRALCTLFKERKELTLLDIQDEILKRSLLAVVTADTSGKPVLTFMTYKMKETSRKMLLYRTIDLSKLEDFTQRLRCKSLAMHGIQAKGEMQDYLVIGPRLLNHIERTHMTAVYIYTILGCKSLDGICPRCFGLNYDSKRFPDKHQYIGYGAMQSIGGPISQFVLDMHKKEAGSSNMNVIKNFHAILTKPAEALQSTLRLAHDGLEESRETTLWRCYVNIFDDSTLARNFEVLVRAQTEFSIVDETKGEYFKGECYLTTQLVANGVKCHKCAPVSVVDSWEFAGKTLTSLAHSNFLRRVVPIVAKRTRNNPDSSIGSSLIGELKSNGYSPRSFSMFEKSEPIQPLPAPPIYKPSITPQSSEQEEPAVHESYEFTQSSDSIYTFSTEPEDNLGILTPVIQTDEESVSISSIEQDLPTEPPHLGKEEETALFGG